MSTLHVGSQPAFTIAAQGEGRSVTNSLKHLRPFIEMAESMGWSYDCTTRGHPRLLPPPGARHPETGELLPAVTFANTTASRRSYDNDLAKLRRAGVTVPRKNPKKKEG